MTVNYVEEFAKLPATCVSDGLAGQNAMDFAIKPLAHHHKIAGRAHTVKIPKGQNKEFLKAIREANAGDVLVVDAEDDTSKAIAGDFILGMAKTLGIKGVVTNGVVRDVEGILELDFPVFCRGTTTVAGSKSDAGYSNISISWGGVVVRQGDIIVGDRDGVVVVPKERENEVLEQAQKKLRKDEERESRVAGDIEDIYKHIDGILGN